MTTRHTHRGHCQLCGAQQAVNNKTGRIAKHGYTTRWGFFSGTCAGSDNLPYEVSTNLFLDRIQVMVSALASFDRNIADTRALATSDPTYGEVLLSRRRFGAREEHLAIGHFAIESEENATWAESGKIVRTKFVLTTSITFRNGETVAEVSCSELYRLGMSYSCHTPEQHGGSWRKSKISGLTNQRQQRQEYHDWLMTRFRLWAPAPLIPV